MCHQEPFPASYAQAFACLWDLVSPQHTHEPRYAMTPHFTPLELEFIPYAGGAWGIPGGCSPRARQPACSPGFFFCSIVAKSHCYGTPWPFARIP